MIFHTYVCSYKFKKLDNINAPTSVDLGTTLLTRMDIRQIKRDLDVMTTVTVSNQCIDDTQYVSISTTTALTVL
jgi:hypothetical protein